MIIQQNKSLKNFNSFGVQCFAENFINIKKDDDIKESKLNLYVESFIESLNTIE